METNNIMPFELPHNLSSIIKVMGIGGGGSNAVNYMFTQNIRDVEFVICNTDAQVLAKSPIPLKLQLGQTLTEGLGAGNEPEQGKSAAIESIDSITEILGKNTKMIFLTVGLGGGTGTGAAPVIAKVARELNLLTVAIVTIPFRYEGKKRLTQAMEGLRELKQYVDSLLVIDNEKIREIYGDLPVSNAFAKADDVLCIAAKGIAEIITVPGHINVDFADVKTVMTNSGVSLMGMGTASGEDRAIMAIQNALSSPLLNNNDIRGAKNILLNIGSGGNKESTMDEVAQINDFVQEAAGQNADIIFGICNDEREDDSLTVTVIATGFSEQNIPGMLAYTGSNINSNSNYKPKHEPISQREFDIFENKEQSKSDDNNIDNETVNANGSKRILIDVTDSDKVDDMESIPAYKLRNIKIKEQENKSQNSGYTASGKGENFGLRDNNPYLFDNID